MNWQLILEPIGPVLFSPIYFCNRYLIHINFIRFHIKTPIVINVIKTTKKTHIVAISLIVILRDRCMFRSQKRYITLNSVFIVLALFNFVFFNTELRDLQSSSERFVNSTISLMCACGSILILFLALKKNTKLLKRFLLTNLFLTGAPLIYQVFSMFLFGLGYLL